MQKPSEKFVIARKSASTNPLKMSPPLGAAMAYLGLDGCLPLFHGSQGCTAFALVLLVRHFKEAIPFQTTAMNEVTTILGGMDNVEQAVLNIHKRARPKVIGICSTGLTETRGEDTFADVRTIQAKHAEALGDTQLVFAATPDFAGGVQEGWGKAVSAMIDRFVPAGDGTRTLRQINVLAGAHMSPGDVDELREIIEAFGLEPIILPDLSGSLDGHVPGRHVGTTYGGTTIADMGRMHRSACTLAIGEHMRISGERLEARTGVPTRFIDGLTGLEAVDRLVVTLAEISGKPVPKRLRRQRSQLVDSMLDGHFHFGGKRIAIAAEPDLLWALGPIFTGMGAELSTVVTTMPAPHLEALDCAKVIVGDLGDLETGAAETGADLLVTHSHGRQASERLGLPLFRVGFPQFDRIGAAHQTLLGYRGTRALVCDLANTFIDHAHHASPADWAGAGSGEGSHGGSQAAAG
ncbi:Nitrogenase FeMo-cofactor scaffold and assembly protein NifN [Caenispirillum salinarum AK4]|uniref:Nitrogenase iron-molybdenum cofactor biosynthesis protein NifN n=1 Tax=Caenispirillum salinarum AK4 TaxID=1238182 RepID=K9GZL4_9PROT|nr:nitrogenase iron-molybdenum cofactor biosynthesis protein NifN [Caenispirillum salinarum]EKV30727.1 Nitrogenase FeMo-cofactor scaffold and assembly protein NifN [Caenispirillum salinarum AK4]